MASKSLASAISSGDLAKVQALVNDGTDVNQLNSDGMGMVAHALDHQQMEIAQFLIESGADIDGKGTVYTPLQAAIDNGAYDVIFSLLERGADVNLKGTEEENYPIHQLAWGYLDPVFFKKMFEAGADLTLTGEGGQTAYDIMQGNLDDNPDHEPAIREILELLAVPQPSD